MLQLHARFSDLYFRQSLHTLQRGLAAIADLLVILARGLDSSSLSYSLKQEC